MNLTYVNMLHRVHEMRFTSMLVAITNNNLVGSYIWKLFQI